MDPFRVPEPGMLVEVRRRQWLVSAVDPYQPDGDTYRQQDMVTLESIEEDSDGERLSVVWQIEPNARILEKAGLPEIRGFDSSEQLDAFLNAVRWGIATNVTRGTLLAPFRSGITIEDYQLDPLVRALDMARVNLLIADDTGLGKTVEAGLVVQELLIRHRARTVLIVAPASDLTNWQREMHDKFGLAFEILDTDRVKEFRRERGIQANPWTAYPYIIASMDWIKQGEGFRLLKEALPPEVSYPRAFDILIVDEAHNIAPAGRGQYAKASLRTRAIQRIAPHFTHHLFLSATPHNGYTESFTSLLELLDNQRFSKNVTPSPTQLNQVMVRRLKRDIVDKEGKPVFPKRTLLPLEIDYTEDERRAHVLLKDFMDLRLDAAEKTDTRLGTLFVLLLLKKRLFSSPAAFAKTLEKFRQSLSGGNRAESIDRRREEKSLRDAIQRANEDAADEHEVEEAEEEVMEKSAELAPSLSAEERTALDELCRWAAQNANREDSKAQAILDWLDSHLKNADGSFNDERVILFTEFMDTHTWLKTILAHHGYGGETLMELHGSLSREDRDRVINAFQTKPGPDSPVRILLATDAASEGINLHNFCKYLIHVEIPWNPTVMEQRNGRIDRHGQKSKEVFIWHPVGKGFDPERAADSEIGDIVGDGYFLLRAAQKVNNIREDLGSAGSVLNEQIENAMLGKSSRLDDTALQLKRRDIAKRMIAMGRELKSQIALLHDKLMDSRRADSLTPDNIRKSVETALALAGKPPLEEVKVGSGSEELSAWKVPGFNDSWNVAHEGLKHPHTGVVRPVVFDGELAKDRDDVVLAHLNHALVKMSLRLLREEIWKTGTNSRLNRVAVRSVPGLAQPMACVFSRLLIVGGDHLRIHEELLLSGGEIRSDGYRRESGVNALKKLWDESSPLDHVTEPVFARLKSLFNRNEKSIIETYERRAEERSAALEQQLVRKKEAEIKAINTLLDELANGIRAELAKENSEELVQMMFDFAKEEKQELKRDFAALRARLEQIPNEKAAEIALVERHYSGTRPLSFPAAVVFLVPATSSWGVKA